MTSWTPPSLKAAAKLPTIELADVGLMDKYRNWFDEHKDIPRCIPPLYEDFVIKFRLAFGSRTHDYIDIVHYSEDLTEFAVCHVLDGKKILTVTSNYLDYDGATVKCAGSAPSNSPFDADWLKREVIAVVFGVLSVQAYILYYRPDVVTVSAPLTDRAEKRVSRRKTDLVPKRLPKTVKRYVRLSVADPEPKEIRYRAIQWQVRGHYRRITAADGGRKIIYVRPHVAKRGNKKTHTKYILEEGN